MTGVVTVAHAQTQCTTYYCCQTVTVSRGVVCSRAILTCARDQDVGLYTGTGCETTPIASYDVCPTGYSKLCCTVFVSSQTPARNEIVQLETCTPAWNHCDRLQRTHFELNARLNLERVVESDLGRRNGRVLVMLMYFSFFQASVFIIPWVLKTREFRGCPLTSNLCSRSSCVGT